MENDRDIIDALQRRRTSMDTDYNLWEPHFRELRDAIQPSRGRFSLGENRKGSTLNKRIIDTAGRKGLRTLRSGLMAGMTSPSRPWFKLSLFDEAALEDPDVKAWLHTVQNRMYTVLRGSNIYRTLDAAYGDLGLYGTFGGLIRGNFESVIHSHAFPMGLFRIGEDEMGVVIALHWDLRLTVKQVVERFGLEKCSKRVQNMWRNNQMSEWIDVCGAAEVRLERDPMSPLASDMPVAMYYWEKTKATQLLMNSGIGTNGILGPRWERCEGDVWSVSSPGMDALGDCVHLQQQHIDKAKAIQMMYNPPMQGPAGFNKRDYRAVPGKAITVTTNDIQRGGLRPTHEVRPDVQHLMMDIQETQRRISESFFEDLFRMTSQFGVEGVKNVTATAIAELHEEKLIALGPVLESLDHGLLNPIIESTFHYMQESNILPPPPENLDGRQIKVEFISLLAQAQKAVGIAANERTIGYIGTLAQIRPDALDKLDVDEAIDDFVDHIGPSPKIIVTTDKANETRQQRIETQQQAALLENAQPLAQSAKLLSEANERGLAADNAGAV